MGGCVPRRGKVGVGPGFLALEQVVRRGRIMKLMWFVAGDPFFHRSARGRQQAGELLGDLFGAAGAHARSVAEVPSFHVTRPSGSSW